MMREMVYFKIRHASSKNVEQYYLRLINKYNF